MDGTENYRDVEAQPGVELEAQQETRTLKQFPPLSLTIFIVASFFHNIQRISRGRTTYITSTNFSLSNHTPYGSVPVVHLSTVKGIHSSLQSIFNPNSIISNGTYEHQFI